jgi:hypothetical protein
VRLDDWVVVWIAVALFTLGLALLRHAWLCQRRPR